MKLILVFLTLISISCDGRKSNKSANTSNNQEAPYNIDYFGDDNYFNYDSLSTEMIQYGKNQLQNFGFKFPQYEAFSSKITEIYKMDIDEFSNSIVILRQNMFPEIAIKTDRYILFKSYDSKNKYEIEPDILFHYNQYVFYNNRNSFQFLISKDPYLLKDLVIGYGFNTDKELVKYVFRDYDFDNVSDFHDLVFSYNPEDKKYYIRKGILDDIENIIYQGQTVDFSYAKEGNGYSTVNQLIKKIENNKEDYDKPDETIAYLFNKTLLVGIRGDIEYKLDTDPMYEPYLKNKNYFGYERLKDYVKYIYMTQEVKNNEESSKTTISDPDGYTNLRQSANNQSKIIQQIRSGEEVNILGEQDNWYYIQTQNGNKGYVHKSRVQTQ